MMLEEESIQHMLVEFWSLLRHVGLKYKYGSGHVLSLSFEQ